MLSNFSLPGAIFPCIRFFFFIQLLVHCRSLLDILEDTLELLRSKKLVKGGAGGASAGVS